MSNPTPHERGRGIRSNMSQQQQQQRLTNTSSLYDNSMPEMDLHGRKVLKAEQEKNDAWKSSERA
jgi:hypothetical protein